MHHSKRICRSKSPATLTPPPILSASPSTPRGYLVGRSSIGRGGENEQVATRTSMATAKRIPKNTKKTQAAFPKRALGKRPMAQWLKLSRARRGRPTLHCARRCVWLLPPLPPTLPLLSPFSERYDSRKSPENPAGAPPRTRPCVYTNQI